MSVSFNTDPTATYGEAEQVARNVRRVTCRNPSAMTFTGTQSYIVGTGRVAVIDPGPDNAAHLDALEAALGPTESISHILVTHSHVDHSPGARLLAARHGAPILAFGAHGAGMSAAMRTLAESGVEIGGGEGADQDFTPDLVIGDGDLVEGQNWRVRALHTPGHLSNHLSFALEETDVVFTGDTVMGWATTLVSPPDGDMASLMASLNRLAGRDDRLFLPGHGHGIPNPAAMLTHQISHREARARQILAALADGPASPTTLAARIYTDVDPALLPAAARNVFATLLGLLAEGRVDTLDQIGKNAVFRVS